MCDTITVINGPYIEDPEQFYAHFRFWPSKYGDADHDAPHDDPCLCSSDIDHSLREKGIPYLNDGPGYTVGSPGEIQQRLSKFTVRFFIPAPKEETL